MTTNAARASGVTSGSPGDGMRAPQGVEDQADAAADLPIYRSSAEAVWSRFEEIIAARSAGRPPDAPSEDATLRRPDTQSMALVTMQPPRGAVADLASATAQDATNAPIAQNHRSAWFYRLQGAALTCVIAIGVAAALGFQQFPSPDTQATRSASAPADPSSAFADAFAQTALDKEIAAPPPLTVAAAPAPSEAAALADDAPEVAVIARIAAADPPYRVVLHLAPDASPREVARLETAIRAWGFSQPEQLPATSPVALPEVAFHLPQDREAATILARIADRILAEAVLTPPPETAGPETAGPEAAGPEAAAPEAAGRLDVYVTTR